MLFQCRASLADRCPIEPILLTMVSSKHLRLDFTIKITVVSPENVKRRSNVVLMLGQHHRQRFNIQPTKRQVNVFTGGQLNVFPFPSKHKTYITFVCIYILLYKWFVFAGWTNE